MLKTQDRLRRLRRTSAIRDLVQETRLNAADFIYPIFVGEGLTERQPINALPGQVRLPLSALAREADELGELGVRAVLVFGVPDHKEEAAGHAADSHGITQEAVRALKAANPDLVVITDVCVCGHTTHGHCGIVRDGEVDNDATLPLLSSIAVSHAEAGADIVAPSAMMDRQVAAIRARLDDGGYTGTSILAYSAKYASAFYGPFREALDSKPQFGDRRAYQMPSPNAREALREAEADIAQEADIVMVKPGLPYLDIVHRIRERFDVPLAVYQVSGEYAMIKAAAQAGWLDEKTAALESLIAFRRAGADLVITYFAKEAAAWLR